MKFHGALILLFASVVNNGKTLELRNFLGQTRIRSYKMAEGVTITRSEQVKDQLELTGNSIEAVSQSAANVHIGIKVPDKDLASVHTVGNIIAYVQGKKGD